MQGPLQFRSWMLRQAVVLNGTRLRFLALPLAMVPKCVSGQSKQSGGMEVSDESAQHEDLLSMQHTVFNLVPPRGILSGVWRAGENIFRGTLSVPLLMSAFAFCGQLEKGFVGALTQGGIGAAFGVYMAFVGYTAACYQLAMGALNSCVAPVHLLFTGRRWHQIAGAWVAPSVDPHPCLNNQPSSESLWERAKERHSNGAFARRRRKASDDGPSYYEALGVDEKASEKEIKDAYNKLVLVYHPDRNPDPRAQQKFHDVTEAYKTLSNSNKRKAYDREGKSGAGNASMPNKRETLQILFGGDEVRRVASEVRFTNLSLRVLDDANFAKIEFNTVHLRQLHEAAVSVRELLDGFDCQSTDNAVWKRDLHKRFQESLDVGLAKEVLYAIGSEYIRFVHAMDSPLPQVVYAIKNTPHRAQHVAALLSAVVGFKGKGSDMTFVTDMLWKVTVFELERNARWVCRALLNDSAITGNTDEQKRRKAALLALGTFFVSVGRPYTGLSEQSLADLKVGVQTSMRKQQQAKSA